MALCLKLFRAGPMLDYGFYFILFLPIMQYNPGSTDQSTSSKEEDIIKVGLQLMIILVTN